MEMILKIKEVNLGKFNNAEYTQFLSFTKELIEKAGLEQLGIADTAFEQFKSNIELLTDAAHQSRISSETKELSEIDKQRNEIIAFLLMNFRSELKNPIEKRRKAGTELYNATKPYSKIKSLPIRQKTQNIEGLITDLTKEANLPHLNTLGIKEAVEKLNALNVKYKKLLANRADSQISVPQIRIGQLRKETNQIYDYLITKAFVSSVASPSEENKTFVHSINKLITDTTIAYKLRQGQKVRKDGMNTN
ncbi:hypothetical protein CGC56_00480 [Capnocytophaga canimorsus]|uniref:Uncharacterized protein n=2 Tax=Capnocytophaga TaxID=1016 RepID=A0A250G0L3_9FLAO|nr:MULTISPECIES: DUF6261 family protein [Capnocytophaga]ATA90781.1 hypothetical protein CGC56_00480 [Capnocytophaga canimorsus]CEN43800.1 putative Conserved Isoleucine--tRNA ligase [Capnocytophaga canis]